MEASGVMEEEHATPPPSGEGANLPAETPAPARAAQRMTENTWAMIVHLSALSGYLFPVVGNIAAPLVVWIIKKDEMPEVDRHGFPSCRSDGAPGKVALNFQISVLIYMKGKLVRRGKLRRPLGYGACQMVPAH